MNDERLIECVRRHVIIYDLSDPKYMDTSAKNEIWAQIGAEMNADGNACKSRWSNIRDTYRKSLKRSVTKSGKAAKYAKVYKYSDQLGFLKRYFDERETVSNISLQEELHEEAGLHAENVGENQFSQQEETEDSTEYQDVQCTSQATKSPLHPAPNIKVKSVAAKNVCPVQETASSQLMNYIIKKNEAPKTQQEPVDLFLNAMAPALKKLSPYYWHMAKFEIFNTVQKYELKTIMAQQNFGSDDNSVSPPLPGPSGNSSVSIGRDETPPGSGSFGLRNFGEFQ